MILAGVANEDTVVSEQQVVERATEVRLVEVIIEVVRNTTMSMSDDLRINLCVELVAVSEQLTAQVEVMDMAIVDHEVNVYVIIDNTDGVRLCNACAASCCQPSVDDEPPRIVFVKEATDILPVWFFSLVEAIAKLVTSLVDSHDAEAVIVGSEHLG
jgi:hypothetical protein